MAGKLRQSRKIRWIAALLALATIALGTKAWSDTMRDAVIERTRVTLPELPDDAAPLRVALISDIHVAGPDMPPERLERIVAQVNALEPDVVLIAGDLVSDKRTATHIYTPEQIVAPLGALDAPLGVIAVPGNHDHWFDMPGLAAELDRHGIALLANEAMQAGPLAIGGLDDDYTGRADIAATLAALGRLRGARIVLSHSPDPFPEMPGSIPLMLAGHTHCGQIAYPWGGAPAHLSDYGDRYGCGRVDENGKTLIVGAGLGTSLIPLRLFTQPTVWLIELRPPEQVAPTAANSRM
ncbi:metallophosphoesterase [Pelagerythrobacter sp.]|uniref:metallophosphoesterase n=1 Tax=Pelagerythrobacter sp. TaxID=2800702 RepID=UPI0035B22F84